MTFDERQDLVGEIIEAVEQTATTGDSFPLLEMILTIILSAIVFFIASYLAQKAKNHATKEDLRKLTTEVEAVKDTFSRESMRDETRFKHFYSRKSEILEKLYVTNVELGEMMKITVMGTHDDNFKKKWSQTSVKSHEARRLADESAIYLDAEEYEKLMGFGNAVHDTLVNVGASNMGPPTEISIAQMDRAAKTALTHMPALLENIKEVFRNSIEKSAEQFVILNSGDSQGHPARRGSWKRGQS